MLREFLPENGGEERPSVADDVVRHAMMLEDVVDEKVCEVLCSARLPCWDEMTHLGIPVYDY